MNTDAALNAARHLSVDIANLTFRLAVAEAVQEQFRELLFYPGLDGTPLRRVDPEMWQRRRLAVEGEHEHEHVEIVLTEAQADAIAQMLGLLEQLL